MFPTDGGAYGATAFGRHAPKDGTESEMRAFVDTAIEAAGYR